MKIRAIEFFTNHGFTCESTGGNCTAFVRKDFDNQETLVTDGDGQAPLSLRCPVRVSVMVDGEEFTFSEYATVQALMDVVDGAFPGSIL